MIPWGGACVRNVGGSYTRPTGWLSRRCFSSGRGRLEFEPDNGAAFVAAAKQARLGLRKNTAFYVHGDDRPGAVADILKKLADARISLGALRAACGGVGTYGAVIFASRTAACKAANVVGATWRRRVAMQTVFRQSLRQWSTRRTVIAFPLPLTRRSPAKVSYICAG
jgi:hypothetical protein